MATYEVTEKILAYDAYIITPSGSEEVLMTIKGKFWSFGPELKMVEGSDGAELANMKGSIFKTMFTITKADGTEMGLLTFPLIAFRKSFTLTVGGKTYKAAGGFTGWKFVCTDDAGNMAFSVTKEGFFVRDKFRVEISDVLDKNIALMAAVAIHQKLFRVKTGA